MDKKKRNILIAIVGIYAILSIIFITIASVLGGDTRERNETLHAEDLDIFSREILAFDNQDTLTFAGRERVVPIFHCMEPYILGDTEKQTAPHQNISMDPYSDVYYTAILKEDSLRLMPGTTDWSYQIDIAITDGREYRLFLKLDNEYEYLFAVVRNQISGSAYFCTTSDDARHQNVATNWVINTVGTDIAKLQNFPPEPRL
jgi:hypothetical protein